MAPNPRLQDARLQALYDRLPTINCKGLCTGSCGPIEMSIRERHRIEKLKGPITCTMAKCSLLTADGRCSVYDLRPLICRLWGLTERMPCEYGCKPSRVLSDDEAWAMLREADAIGGDPGPGVRMRKLRADIERTQAELARRAALQKRGG